MNTAIKTQRKACAFAALLTCLGASFFLASPAMAQDPVASDNLLNLLNEGNNNLVVLEQAGELNSLNLLIQANNVSVNMLQQGSSNLIAGVNGAPEFTIAGHNSHVSIAQSGFANQVYGMQLSANSTISVTQVGYGNIATIIQR